MQSESNNAKSKYPDATSQSARLHRRAQQVLPGGNTRTTVFHAPYPIYAKSANGCRITDMDGVERLDFLNNYTSLIHGHLNPGIMEAVRGQLALGTCFANPTESEIALAEVLCRGTPSFERVRFSNSGSEAVMNAIKAARAYTGRPKIAKCEGVYHGSYDPVEVSLDSSPENWGDHAPARVAYSAGTPQSVLDDVVVIPFNETDLANSILEPEAGSLAAVIVDIMPNRAGLIPARAEFLNMLREFTRRHGIVLIFDEVITFRNGPGGMQVEWGVEPDLTTLGKIIGGGFPVGAVAGRAEVMEVFNPGKGKPPLPHGGTFNANPVTMVAGLAAMEQYSAPSIARLEELGERAREVCRNAFRSAEMPGQVTGHGSLLRLHLTESPLKSYRDARHGAADRQRFSVLHASMLNHGVFMAPSGLMALSTPMEEADIDRMGEALLHSLKELRRHDRETD